MKIGPIIWLLKIPIHILIFGSEAPSQERWGLSVKEKTTYVFCLNLRHKEHMLALLYLVHHYLSRLFYYLTIWFEKIVVLGFLHTELIQFLG